jgi:DNA-binding NtrC family response regulator
MVLFHRIKMALVITDIIMPEMEGIETIRAMSGEAPAIPILAISGSSQPLYLNAATRLGAAAVLEKPFTAEDLLDMAEKLLRHRQMDLS